MFDYKDPGALEKVGAFIESLRKDAKKSRLELRLSDTELVYAPEDPVPTRGYFLEDPLILAVGMDTRIGNWLALLLHESCHFDQWREKDPTYKGAHVGKEDATDLVFRWVGGEDIPLDTVHLAIDLTKECELNCERRVVKKIRQFDLPLDIEEYCKRASAYIHYYNYMKIRRVMYGAGYSPYYDTRILDLMPTNLRGRYVRLPQEFLEAYDKFFSEKLLNDRLKNKLLLREMNNPPSK